MTGLGIIILSRVEIRGGTPILFDLGHVHKGGKWWWDLLGFAVWTWVPNRACSRETAHQYAHRYFGAETGGISGLRIGGERAFCRDLSP